MEMNNETPISMAEVKDILDTVEKRDTELNFREGRTKEYINHFNKLDLKKAEGLRKRLSDLNLVRLKEEQLIKLVDTIPKSAEELKSILQGYNISLSKDDLNKVVSVLKE